MDSFLLFLDAFNVFQFLCLYFYFALLLTLLYIVVVFNKFTIVK